MYEESSKFPFAIIMGMVIVFSFIACGFLWSLHISGKAAATALPFEGMVLRQPPFVPIHPVYALLASNLEDQLTLQGGARFKPEAADRLMLSVECQTDTGESVIPKDCGLAQVAIGKADIISDSGRLITASARTDKTEVEAGKTVSPIRQEELFAHKLSEKPYTNLKVLWQQRAFDKKKQRKKKA